MGVTLDPTTMLKKGDRVSLGDLSKHSTIWIAGLGWDVAVAGDQDFDLDAWALLLCKGEVISRDRIVTYDPNDRTAKVSDASGAVTYMGDNRDGQGDGDDEQIRTDLSLVPADVDQIIYLANIYDAIARRQTFGLVSNAYIRMIVEGESTEKRSFSLSDNAGASTTVVFGRLVRDLATPTAWDFETIEKWSPSLAEALKPFGIDS